MVIFVKGTLQNIYAYILLMLAVSCAHIFYSSYLGKKDAHAGGKWSRASGTAEVSETDLYHPRHSWYIKLKQRPCIATHIRH